MLELWQGYAPGAEHDMLAALAGRSRAAGWLVTDGFLALAARPEQTADTEGQLGHAFLVANLPALALAPFQHAVKLAPKDGEAHSYLGWTLLLLGRTAQAREEIDQGLELSPAASFAWFAAGELALAEQQPGPAIRYFQEGATLDPHNPLFWAEAGRAALLLHDYASAEQMLQTASDLSKSPAEAIALLHLYVDFHVGFLDGSARHAGIDAVHRWPGNETLELLLAEIFTDNNESANAYYAALAAHVLDPTDPGPYVILGAQAENEGDYGHAALLLRVALALSPDGPFASQAEMLLAPIQDVSA
jgi:Flp pilus assembly protein TadD